MTRFVAAGYDSKFRSFFQGLLNVFLPYDALDPRAALVSTSHGLPGGETEMVKGCCSEVVIAEVG
jgi:hypothetical protein